MSKKLLAVGVITLIATVLVGVGASTVSAQATNMCAVVDALALAGVIAPDKVAAAKAAAGCGAAATSGAGLSLTRDLTMGSTGADVTALQNALIGMGYSIPAGATGYFGAQTQAAVKAYQTAKGIAPAAGYVGPLTRASLNTPVVVVPPPSTGGTTGTPSTDLEGGAGDVVFTTTSTGLEDTLKEGENNVKVLAFKAEAEDSDIAITSIKVTLENNDYASSSEKLTNYVDEVTVWMGSTEVGSADASDFSREAGSPDVYSKTISLSDAVIDEGVKATFYVAVSAVSSIDSDDLTADWKVDVTTTRYTDGTGAIMSEDQVGDHDQVFTFEDVSTDDGMSIKTSSANPVASPIMVDADANTDEVLVGAFKLDVDDDSSDVTIFEIPVVLTINDSDNTAFSDDAEDIIDSVMVKIAGDEYSADLSTSTVANGDGTATYLVTLDDEELVLEGGDVVEVKIYVTFNSQEDNYGSGTTVYASVTGSAIDAEGEEDEITVSGTFTGKTHTLEADTPVVVFTSAVITTTGSSDAGESIAQKYVATFKFDVKAPNDDAVYLPLNTFAFGTSADQGIEYTVTGGATKVNAALTSTATKGSNGYIVYADDTESFTFTVTLEGNDATGIVAIDSIWYEISDATPNGDPAITTGLDDFEATKYLAQY